MPLPSDTGATCRRMAALDVGDSRVGIAICDALGLTVTGLGVVRRVGGVRDLDAIARLLAPYSPEQLVVGLPLNMDGSEGRQAAKTRRFGERVAAHLQLPLAFQDERLSSFEAEERLRTAGLRGARRRALVDQVAATVILEDYLAQVR